MNNKLQDVVDEFHSLYGWRLQDDLQQEVREYLCNKLVEYARSVVPDKVEDFSKEDSFADIYTGHNECIDMFISSIDKDIQSLS